MSTLVQGRENYVKYLRDVRRRATNTLRNVEDRIDEFNDWADNNRADVRYTQELNAEMMATYVAECYGHLSDGSFNLYVGTLKRWLHYLVEEGQAKPGVARLLVPREKPKPVRKKQFIREAAMLQLAEAGLDWHVRDKYYILLTYRLARRYSEISAMRVRDVDLAPRPHMAYGCFTFDNLKGRKENVTLPLTVEGAKDVREWLEIYDQDLRRTYGEKHGLKQDHYLIPKITNASGRARRGVRMPLRIVPSVPLSYSGSVDVLERAGLMAFPDAENPENHGLRRGALDDLITLTGDIRLGQTMADHASQKTTELYTDNDRAARDLGDAFERLAQGSAPVEEPTEGTNVVSLADRMARRKSLA